MKRVHSYQCEICEEVYHTEKTAVECEETHKAYDRGLDVVEMKFEADVIHPTEGYGYPSQIVAVINEYSGSGAIYQLIEDGAIEGIYEEWEK